MQKTKLGVSVGLMGFILFLSVGFGGYVPMLIIGGYILLFESNEWLKKAAIKAAVLLVGFSLISGVVGLIPSAVTFVNEIFAAFNSYFSLNIVTGLFGAVSTVVSVAKTVLFMLLAIKALTQGTIRISFVDKLIQKHTEGNSAQ